VSRVLRIVETLWVAGGVRAAPKSIRMDFVAKQASGAGAIAAGAGMIENLPMATGDGDAGPSRFVGRRPEFDRRNIPLREWTLAGQWCRITA
jgi:hypothetical protein